MESTQRNQNASNNDSSDDDSYEEERDDLEASSTFDLKVSYDMSKQEMFQVIDTQKKEIRYMTQRLKQVEKEREDMIDQFKLSSSVLLERIKDLEAQANVLGERPQTAHILNKISMLLVSSKYISIEAEANGGRIGQVRGRSKNKKSSPGKKQGKNTEEEKKEEDDDNFDAQRVLCPNCKQIFSGLDMVTHTVTCYRNSTKCKLCGEVIIKDRKKEHLSKWRDLKILLNEIENDNEGQASLYFDHGVDANLIFPEDPEVWSPMHYAAKFGALNVVIGLISRGAGVDPTDINQKTPLMVAIENNKFTVARSLIEFGSDIEAKDSSSRTPLMFACRVGSKEMVELLLSYKADIKATNQLGDSCLTFAQKSGNPEIMGLLVRSGASIRPASRQNSVKIGTTREGSRIRINAANI